MTEGSAGEATPDKRPSADGGPVDWSAFVNIHSSRPAGLTKNKVLRRAR